MSWQTRKKKTTVKSDRSKVVDRLDTIFSKYIRRRDCGFSYGRCISCGSIITYSSSDAGHYINRKHMSLRFDEVNVNAQCRQCNRFDEGNVQGYRRGLIEKYGEKATDMLEIKKHNSCHLSIFEIELLINEYELKLAQIESKLKKT